MNIIRYFNYARIALGSIALFSSAQAGITGTFVSAQDGLNSFQSGDGVAEFSDPEATVGLWHERSDNFAIAGIPGSGAYQGQDKAGAATHNEIVTTLTDLTAGQSYDVYMIMGIDSGGSSGTQNIDAGFSPGVLTTLNAERSVYHGLSYIETVVMPSVSYVPERTLASPDGKQVFHLERKEPSGQLVWSVTHAGRAVLTRGALGLDLSGIGVVGGEGAIGNVVTRTVDTTWTPPYGEQSVVRDHYREETLTLEHEGHAVRLQVRAYDEGVALRYLIDGAGTHTVTGERTAFPLPESAQVWVAAHAQGVISKMAIGSVKGAVERPLTAELTSDLFVALGEAGLMNHARMKFARSGTSTLVPSLSGSSTHTGAFATPWRYVRAAHSAAELLEGNQFMLNLNEPSLVADPSWIHPGKVLREITLTTQGGMACVDFAVAHKLQFVHFDAGWYGAESSDATTVTVDPARSAGPLDLPTVLAHAKASGVGVILYVNRRALESQLDELLPLYQSTPFSRPPVATPFSRPPVRPNGCSRGLTENQTPSSKGSQSGSERAPAPIRSRSSD